MEFQLLSYEAALGSKREGTLETEVRNAFIKWSDPLVLAKEQVKFFIGNAEGMKKVFVLIPLIDNPTQTLKANWDPTVSETLKLNVRIKLDLEFPPQAQRVPLTIP